MKKDNLSQKLINIIKNMPEAVAIYEAIDGGGNFIIKYFNKSAEKIEGVRASNIINRKITAVFPGVKKFGILAVLRRVYKTGKSERFPLAFYRDKKISGWRDNYIFKLSSGDVAVFYTDETKNKQYEEELLRNQEKLSITLKSIGDAVIVTDEKGRIVLLNEIAQKITGWSEKCAVGRLLKEIFVIFNEKTGEAVLDPVVRVIKTGKIIGLGNHTVLINKGGERILIEDSASPIKNTDGKIMGVVLVFRDVTKKRELDKKLIKTSKTLETVSKCNKALVRAKDEKELLNKICKIIVDSGEYNFAWIGYAQNDKDKSVSPVAEAGFERGYLESAKIVWSDTLRGRGPTGTAIRTGKVVVCRDILHDRKFAPWRKAAIKQGYASSISLPIFIDDLVGVVNVYSPDLNVFNNEEINLLKQLAADLSFGIKSLRWSLKLKENEEKYLSLYDNAVDAIFIADPITKKLINCNKAAEKLLGCSRKEILSMRAEELHPKNLVTETMAGFNRQVKGRLEQVFSEILTKNNRRVPVSINSSIINIGGKKYLQGIFRDITKQKYIEKKLKESEERYKTIVDNVNDAFYLHDFKGKILDVNKNACRMTGYSCSELIGKNAAIIDAPDEAKFIPKRIRKVLKLGKFVFESKHRKKDGTIFWVSVSAKLVSKNNGGIIESFVRDISEKKTHELRLRESEERYRNLISNLPKTEYVLVHRNGKLIWINKNVPVFLGLSKEKIIGTQVLNYVEKDYHDVVLNSIKMRSAGKKVGEYEIKVVNKFGEDIDVRVRGSDIDYEGEKATLLVLSDISDHKKTEKIIEESEERYRIIAEQTGELIYDYNLLTGHIKWNGPIKKVVGYTDKEFESFDIKAWERAIKPSDRSRVVKALDICKKNKTIFEVVYGFKNKKGNFIDVQDRGVFLYDQNGRAYRMLGAMSNISDVIKKDRELERANTDLVKFKLAVDNASDDILITDSRGVILYANSAIQKTNGYSLKEIIGKTPAIWGRQMPPEFYENFWKTIFLDKQSFVGEMVNKRKNGALYNAEVKVSPILNNKNEVEFFVGIQRDITRLKEIDRAKSEFVSVASHQLKTPLSGISGLWNPYYKIKKII